MKTEDESKSKNLDAQMISQKDFDKMSETKRQFFLELIKKGQVQIYAEEEKKPERERRAPFAPFRNKDVVVALMNGQTVEGILTDVWLYEIGIEFPDKTSILILKHAMVSVKLK